MFNVIKVEGLIGIEDLHDSREALPDVLGAEGDAGRVTGPELTDSQTNIFTLLSTELFSPVSCGLPGVVYGARVLQPLLQGGQA